MLLENLKSLLRAKPELETQFNTRKGELEDRIIEPMRSFAESLKNKDKIWPHMKNLEGYYDYSQSVKRKIGRICS